MNTRISTVAGVAVLATLVLWATASQAFETYSAFKILGARGVEESMGYCRNCHGHFRATDAENSNPSLQDEYVSPTDGEPWREIYQEVEETEPAEEVGLHDVHRHIILDKIGRSRCNVCHSEGGRYPVFLNSSATTDLEPISCVGCHGRAEDAGFDSISAGLGAGLRQHHTNAGVTLCKACHLDADPANYAPVGEDVLPPFYSEPLTVFVNHPTDPCNWMGSEDYAGGRDGLDNDGDGSYDKYDSDCRPFGQHNQNRK